MLSALQDETSESQARSAQSIENQLEMARLLTQVRDHDAPVQLRNSQGDSVTCTLHAVDEPAARIGFGVDDQNEVLQSLLHEGQAQASTNLDGIRVEFDVSALVMIRAANSCSLQAAFPRSLSRHQRRQSFRVRVAPRGAPAVRIEHPQRPKERLALRVLDISIGGCSLLLPENAPALDNAAVLKSVRVDLSPGTYFSADLLVRSLLPTTTPAMRLGCEWKSIDGAAQRTLQRFIDDAQRRWRSPVAR